MKQERQDDSAPESATSEVTPGRLLDGLVLENRYRDAIHDALTNQTLESEELEYAVRGLYDRKYYLYRNEFDLVRYLISVGPAVFSQEPVALGRAVLDGLGILVKLRQSRKTLEKDAFIVFVHIQRAGDAGIAKKELAVKLAGAELPRSIDEVLGELEGKSLITARHEKYIAVKDY